MYKKPAARSPAQKAGFLARPKPGPARPARYLVPGLGRHLGLQASPARPARRRTGRSRPGWPGPKMARGPGLGPSPEPAGQPGPGLARPGFYRATPGPGPGRAGPPISHEAHPERAVSLASAAAVPTYRARSRPAVAPTCRAPLYRSYAGAVGRVLLHCSRTTCRSYMPCSKPCHGGGEAGMEVVDEEAAVQWVRWSAEWWMRGDVQMGEQGRPAPRDYIFDALGVLDERVWQALRSRILLAGEVNVLHARQPATRAPSPTWPSFSQPSSPPHPFLSLTDVRAPPVILPSLPPALSLSLRRGPRLSSSSSSRNQAELCLSPSSARRVGLPVSGLYRALPFSHRLLNPKPKRPPCAAERRWLCYSDSPWSEAKGANDRHRASNLPLLVVVPSSEELAAVRPTLAPPSPQIPIAIIRLRHWLAPLQVRLDLLSLFPNLADEADKQSSPRLPWLCSSSFCTEAPR
ncbi:hypothetical protein HU200_053482 [Digitaria exilis]|uniref:Uncharacterized protein n=1 Tax=Digitaria exilis TaxID=1010633 RepID=A0A835E8C9_9POAL|nr:hypothetical protein HU200_053482 [Digitaria exilis]